MSNYITKNLGKNEKNRLILIRIKSYLFFKRLTDISLSLIGLLFLSPLMFFVSMFYLIGKNKGPILFKQKRVGINGEEFYIYKFRSMVVNAEAVLLEDKELHNKYIANNYKLSPEEDPRITKFGQFIRKTSIDELPQLLNVLKGEMSIIGPRPVVGPELLEYQKRMDVFLSVKPGVTGYWQICGRSNVNYPERADLEFYYIDNRSPWLDMKILVLTILLVLSRKGAY